MQPRLGNDFEPEWGRWCCAAVLLATLTVVGALIVGPMLGDLVATQSLSRGFLLNRSDAQALGWSLGYAATIGILATLLGWPLAGLLARRGILAGVVLLPVMLPPYLAYAGWGQLRAPGTFLGDWLLTRSAAGTHWWPIAAGRLFAVLGLALWASPIAGVVMAAGLTRRGQGFDEALQMDRAGPVRTALERFCFHKGELLAGVALVTLVMLGSAIPLHVAQVPTYSIELWLDLAESHPSSWGLVWAGAWPMLAIAIFAAWAIAARAIRPAGSTNDGGDGGGAQSRRGEGGASTQRLSRTGALAGVLVWSLAIVVPVLICILNITGLAAFGSLWALDRAALLTSLGRSLVVGVVLLLIATVTSVLLSSDRASDRSLVRWAARVSLLLGLMPGFLIGAAMSRGWGAEFAGPILAQIARFAFVGVLGGVWACRGESPEHRAARRLDSMGGLRGWWWTVLPNQWRILLGVALAGAALSLHEIEATIFLEPPGSGSLAQKMLGHLHFARMDELNAMSLVVVAIALLPAILAGVFLSSIRSATPKNRDR